MQHDKILILDFGSQVTQLIARRVREAHVLSEVHPCDVTDEWVREYAADGHLKGVILSGSHASVYEETTDKAPQAVFDLGVPVLGICYGMQTMAHQLGGKVEGGHKREFGFASVRAHGHTALLKDIADFTTPEGHGMLNVWMSHGDKVTELPPGFKLMASTESCPIAGMADEARRYYALQFHPEVTHTVQGKAIIERFVLGICQAKPDWVMRDHIAEAVQKIREQVGDEEVILGLSGGVDSSVAAALIHRAIGDQLTCVFVDHGLLRLNEGDMVMEMFEGKLHAKVIRVDASELFLGKLAGVSDPEAKRKIIGGEFVTVFKQEAAKLKARPSWRKAPSTPTSSSRAAPRARRPSPSRATTTWAVCPSSSASSCWSRCATCSRTKCANSAWRSACRPRWCIGIHFPAQAWACASLAK
jgi:GMP synthase (glutamine-hydrolysing)